MALSHGILSHLTFHKFTCAKREESIRWKVIIEECNWKVFLRSWTATFVEEFPSFRFRRVTNEHFLRVPTFQSFAGSHPLHDV